jgi:clan AA aspartic protease (TIGR02281 family)
MMHRGLLAVGIIGLLLGWCANLEAEDKAPDEIMQAKGMTKVGSFYLLEDDAKLSEWLKLTRSTQKTLDDNLKKRAEIDKGIKLADSSIAKWDSEVRQLQEKHQKVKDNAYQYNDIGSQINLLLGKIRDASRFKADRETELKKLGDPREDYVGMVLELSEKMEAAAREYETLAKDPEVKGALTRMGEKGMPKMKLGPSAQFIQELPFIRGQRKAITTAAIKLNIDEGVPHVQATLNGKLSRSMVVDSGAALVTLTWDLAQELGWKQGATDQTIELRAADGKKINARLMVLQSIRVGQFTAENVQCAVLPKSMAGDNLLGGTFLRNFVYRMDLGAGELHLTEIVIPQVAQAASRPVVEAKETDKNTVPATQAARNIFDLDDADLIPATRPADLAPRKPEIAITVPSPSSRPATTMPATAPSVLARLPVPLVDERQKARQLVKEVFATELVDASPTARRTLADHLLNEAEKTLDPPVDQFVLLSGALRAAEDAKDLTLCFRVINVLAGRFDVNALHLRTRSAWKAAAVADSGAQTVANCEAGLSLLEELIASDNFNDASGLLGKLSVAATADPHLNAIVKAQATRMEALQVARAAVAKDLEKLRSSPADPSANFSVGKFLCFYLGAWDRGLPMLTRGSDVKLAALAKLELGWPANGEKQIDIGDAWWAFGENGSTFAQQQIRRHAAKSYESALPELKGLIRVRVEQRLKAVDPDAGHVVDLLKLIRPDRDTVQGKFEFHNGELVSTGDGQQRVEAKYIPPDEYDFEIDFTELGDPSVVIQILSKKATPFIWVMGSDGTYTFHYIKGGSDFGNNTSGHGIPVILKNARHRSVVQVRNSGVKTFFDGKLVQEWKTDYTNIIPDRPFWRLRDNSFVGLGVGGAVVFHTARIREVTGRGQVKSSDQGQAAAPLNPDVGSGHELLGLVNLDTDKVAGRCTLDGHQLTVTGNGRVIIPYSPKGNYELRIKAMRQRGSNDILVYFPAGDTITTLVLSGGGGFASGLEKVDGQYHEKNKTTVKPGNLINEKWYDIGIRVSEAGADAEILVQLDGADYIHWRGAKSDLTPYDDVPDRVKRGKLIMLGSAHDAVDVFASVNLVENLTAQGARGNIRDKTIFTDDAVPPPAKAP